jgi:hypothetical protein
LTKDRLPSAGVRFLREFAATQPRGTADVSAAYAAQAAQVLLHAIARSDGTRACVTAELLRARVRGGILGGFRITSTDDIEPSPVTILRPRRAGGSNAIQGYEGADIVRVIEPPPRLVR